MMKINYLSDVHIEFGPLYHDLSGEVLILAGDIHVKAKTTWINEAARYFEHVIYVLGNHELYRGDLNRTPEKIKPELSPNVHMLQNESITIDGVTFHCGTLWTDMDRGNPMTAMRLKGGMNDFKLIRTDHYENRFTPTRWMMEHQKTLRFLQENVKPGDVVVTHHAPSWLSIHEKFKGDDLNGGYYSDLSGFIDVAKPALWFHGHIHDSADYVLYTTRVLCNPRGYVHEQNPAFDVNASVEI